jgi:hypothetical protein
MTIKTYYIGDSGPFKYDDALDINDPDGLFTGRKQQGFITDGDLDASGGSSYVLKHNLSTAANDFLVGSGSNSFVKKTLAETRSILGVSSFVCRGDATAYDYTLGSFTTDMSWRDLDLSAIVPTGAFAVLLKTQLEDDAADSVIQYRTNGYSNIITASTVRTQVAGINAEKDSIVFMDANRVIEYRATNTTFTAINVVVIGWWL